MSLATSGSAASLIVTPAVVCGTKTVQSPSLKFSETIILLTAVVISVKAHLSDVFILILFTDFPF